MENMYISKCNDTVKLIYTEKFMAKHGAINGKHFFSKTADVM